MIFHIVTKPAWNAAKEKGFYEAPSLATEGFIHTSKQNQVTGVQQRYYAQLKDLLLLHIDEQLLKAPLKYEIAPSVGEEYPHIYGALNLDAVVKVEELAPLV